MRLESSLHSTTFMSVLMVVQKYYKTQEHLGVLNLEGVSGEDKIDCQL